jgi:predicted nucleic acid-binding protein
MRYVLDSSVAFKWLVPEMDTPKALRLRNDFRNGVHDLIAPDNFPVETIHALTRAERQGRVTPAKGHVLFKDLMKNLPLLHPCLPLLPRANEISSTWASASTTAFMSPSRSEKIADSSRQMTNSSRTFRAHSRSSLHWRPCRD